MAYQRNKYTHWRQNQVKQLFYYAGQGEKNRQNLQKRTDGWLIVDVLVDSELVSLNRWGFSFKANFFHVPLVKGHVQVLTTFSRLVI